MGRTYIAKIKNFFHPFLLPLKGLFFFQMGAISCLIPYIPLFIQHLGLNAAENGIVFGVLPFIATISKPSAGTLADKLKTPLIILRIFFIIQLTFMFSVYFVPKIEQPPTLSPLYNISCFKDPNFSLEFPSDYEKPWIRMETIASTVPDTNGNFSCNLTTSFGESHIVTFPNQSYITELSQLDYLSCNCSWLPFPIYADQSIVRWTMQFWLTGLILIIGWFGYGAVTTLMDAIAFKIVQRSPVRTTYGENRAFGTMGWAIFSLLVGLLLDTFSETTAATDRDFTPAFVTFFVVASCGFIATFFLQSTQDLTESVANIQEKIPTKISPSQILLTFDVLLFLGGTFVMGLCTGMLYGYLGWYQSELGATSFLLGLTTFVQCCYEAPMMAVSGWIIRKVGYHGCMLLCLLSFAIRFIAYYFVVDPWFMLLIDMTHAVGFGLFYATMNSFAFDKAPSGATGSLQGVLGATYEGFGQGIGGLSAGFLYQEYGGSTTWLGFGILAFVAALFYSLGVIFLWKRRPTNNNSFDIPLT